MHDSLTPREIMLADRRRRVKSGYIGSAVYNTYGGIASTSLLSGHVEVTGVCRGKFSQVKGRGISFKSGDYEIISSTKFVDRRFLTMPNQGEPKSGLLDKELADEREKLDLLLLAIGNIPEVLIHFTPGGAALPSGYFGEIRIEKRGPNFCPYVNFQRMSKQSDDGKYTFSGDGKVWELYNLWQMSEKKLLKRASEITAFVSAASLSHLSDITQVGYHLNERMIVR